MGGGRVVSRLLDVVSQTRRGERGKREQRGSGLKGGGGEKLMVSGAHGCIGVNLCLQEFT